MKLLKSWWFWLIIVLLILGVLATIYFIRFYKNLKFEFKPGGDLGKLLSVLENFQTSRSTDRVGIYLDIPYKAIIDNANNVGINLKDLFANISYNGETVLRTKAESSVLNDISIPANVTGFEINDNIEVLINENSIKLIRELMRKSKPEVSINLRAKSLGIPINQTFKQQLEY